MTAEKSISGFSSFLSNILIRVLGTNQFIRPNTKWCIVEPVDDENVRLHLTFDFSHDKATVKINTKTLEAEQESFKRGSSSTGPYKAEVWYGNQILIVVHEHGVGHKQVVKHETKEQHGEITYYVPSGGSFREIANHHVNLLPSLGYTVNVASLDYLLGWRLTNNIPFRSEWGILQPLFYVFQTNLSALWYLINAHDRLASFDVADTTRLSRFAVKIANKMDLIMVPSNASKKAYLASGVKTSVRKVPHGVNEELYSQPKNPMFSFPKDKTKILFFFLHSELRKGADIVKKVMPKIMQERNDVHLIVKSSGPNALGNLTNTTYVTRWLSEQEMIGLYDSCDILIAPSRGGGFELNVLEALARGLVVITSDWEAIREYAGKYALTIKPTGRKVTILPDNPIHVGYGTDPDPNHFHELLNYAIDNLDYLKKKAEKNAPKIVKKYSWRKVAEKIKECLEAVK